MFNIDNREREGERPERKKGTIMHWDKKASFLSIKKGKIYQIFFNLN
jgi:hypothetical protein